MPDEEDLEEVVPIPERHVVMTPTGVTIVMSEEDQRRAHECLERSGRITLNFGEISVSGFNEIRRLTRFDPPDGGIGPID